MNIGAFLCLSLIPLITSDALPSRPIITANKGLCKNNEHAAGRWTHSNITRKSFHCCEWSERVEPERCGVQEQHHHLLIHGSDERSTFAPGNACQCDFLADRDKISSREMYLWKPAGCSLLKWNATQFCALLGNRKILFAGDSTMQQSAATVMSMIQAGNGGCAHQLSSGPINHLTLKAHRADVLWDEYYRRIRPDITIVTCGAHLQDIGDIWSIWDMFKTQLTALRATYGNGIKVYWKTQNPGHIDCQNHHRPVANYTEFAEDRLKRDKYHWNIYPVFDAVSRNFTRELGLGLIDMSPLYTRPDAHPLEIKGKDEYQDCLHFCLPGPLDIFSNIIFTMLYTGEM